MTGILKGLFDTFIHNQNQFASGGLLLMAVGSVVALFRQIPEKIWAWIKHQTTISLTVTDNNSEFTWLRGWLETRPIMKKARHIDVATNNRWDKTAKTVLAPAPGHHWMLHGFRPLSVTVTRNSDTKSGEYKESISFTTIGRDQKFFRKFIDDVTSFKRGQAPKPELYVWNKDEWYELTPYTPRSLDSVFFPKNMKEKLLKDIQIFRNSQMWYSDMGIPYHRGYLFEGPPGSGKTSLVVGLSSRFNAKVYILKISEMSDTSLRDAITKTDPNSFVVMEDIDCVSATAARKTADDNGEKEDGVKPLFSVSLSGLLNILDGLLAPIGVMYFMTTNHVEKLDPALIRPGRIDVQEHIGIADASQKTQMFERFFPGETIPTKYLNESLTMAELQQILMEKRNAKL